MSNLRFPPSIPAIQTRIGAGFHPVEPSPADPARPDGPNRGDVIQAAREHAEALESRGATRVDVGNRGGVLTLLVAVPSGQEQAVRGYVSSKIKVVCSGVAQPIPSHVIVGPYVPRGE